jgi:hypothetical protein
MVPPGQVEAIIAVGFPSIGGLAAVGALCAVPADIVTQLLGEAENKTEFSSPYVGVHRGYELSVMLDVRRSLRRPLGIAQPASTSLVRREPYQGRGIS